MTQNSVSQAADLLTRNLGASFLGSSTIMNYSSRRPYADTLSLMRDHPGPSVLESL